MMESILKVRLYVLETRNRWRRDLNALTMKLAEMTITTLSLPASSLPSSLETAQQISDLCGAIEPRSLRTSKSLYCMDMWVVPLSGSDNSCTCDTSIDCFMETLISQQRERPLFVRTEAYVQHRLATKVESTNSTMPKPVPRPATEQPLQIHVTKLLTS
jgi:hypothetical protein